MPRESILIVAMCTIAAGSCAGMRPETAGRPSGYSARSDSSVIPRFGLETVRVSQVLEFPDLWTVQLPPGEEEIRIWSGFGMTKPEEMLRVRRYDGTVTGEVYLWWKMAPDPANDSISADFFEEMNSLAGALGCQDSGGPDPNWSQRPNRRRYTDDEAWIRACRIDFGPDEPEWSEVWQRLQASRAFVLPDPSTLYPPEAMVMDGIYLQVEILMGDIYRTYTYSNPDLQPWPEAVFAESVLGIARSYGRHR